MMEQKEILQSVRDNLSELSKTADSDAYDFYEIIENCVSILDDILDDQQQVGEYFKRPNNDICKVTSIENGTAYITFLNAERGNLLDTQFNIKRDGKFYKKATDEQIALFRRAEHFHSKNRKLNEFKLKDLVKYGEEVAFVTYLEDYVVINDIEGYDYEDVHVNELSLIMTAEELEAAAQEVKG